MNYQVVFDVTQTPPNWRGLIGGAAFVGLGLVVWFFRHKVAGRGPPYGAAGVVRTVFAGLFLGFNVLWLSWVAWATLGSHHGATRAMRDGSVRVVEGVVENFDPMPFEGHKAESFTVNGVRFKYSDYMEAPGFHQSRSHGGPMEQGLHVRIHYAGDQPYLDILKLEVAGK